MEQACRCAKSVTSSVPQEPAQRRALESSLTSCWHPTSYRSIEPFSLTRQHTQQWASLEDRQCVIWHLLIFFARKFVNWKPRRGAPRLLVPCLRCISCRGPCRPNPPLTIHGASKLQIAARQDPRQDHHVS